MSVLISLLLISLLDATVCNIYIVTPDNHHYPNITCRHCHNLQYYLLNVTKYFTSNTQLLFLPGVHYLHTDLTIQNVHNISLIGSADDNVTPVSIIQYYSTNNIAISNSTMVTVKTFLITKCQDMYHGAGFKILNCHYMQLHNIIVDMEVRVHNMMGKSNWSNITSSNGLNITYDDNISANAVTHALEICNYTLSKISFVGISIKIIQMLYDVYMTITDSVFTQLHTELTVFINSSYMANENEILFNKVKFINNHYMRYILYIQFDLQSYPSNETIYTIASKQDEVVFRDCMFTDSNNVNEMIHCEWFQITEEITQMVIIQNCLIKNNTNCINILLFMSHSISYNPNVFIVNTDFISNTCNNNDEHITTLVSSDNSLVLLGTVIIHGNTFESLFTIHKGTKSIMQFYGYIEFSENEAIYMIQSYMVSLHIYTVLNITRNVISYMFVGFELKGFNNHIPLCYFQFYGNKSKIIIENTNLIYEFFNQEAQNTNCKMLYEHNPLYIYQQFIYFQTNYGVVQLPFHTGALCYCLGQLEKCDINQLRPIFPGQTLAVDLCINNRANFSIKTILISVEMYDASLPKSHCKVPLSSEMFYWILRNCTEILFTILSKNEEHCELYLNAKGYKPHHDTIFYIKLLKCPMGFSFDDKTEKCECDSSMQSKLLSITNCNINDQTILRPANSWMTAKIYNNSYTYQISPNCPFDYCLPQSSYLNFSTPNSQCQFNRSGLLCGECQKYFSTTIGPSKCKYCSNTYLLLIIPFTVAGALQVFILFLINLTVTDGTISAFIMYTNIIGINDHVFFTDTKHVFTPAYTFISLANLDLGIQTCFYNGMDDYAKMWLQLVFPFYLMFIATLLIIASRYSISAQRLTARRVLPVLATLFLLSYTKILRTVSSVLFSYSTITHLPSKHTTTVWSVDANVPLFGAKFTILFIVCLILFFVLVPFNIILLCTRTLSQFQFINKFKPLLDAYQGPYKHRFYYWTGLQLLIRAVFFGISALDQNTNLIVSTIILSVIIGLHGAIQPFKNSFKNYHEFLYIINLQILYILTLPHYQGATTVNVMVTLAAIQFIFIIIYHIITYLYNGVIGIKINNFTNTVTTWISKFNKPSSNVDLQLHTIEIPEVTYNYREYREPLIG